MLIGSVAQSQTVDSGHRPLRSEVGTTRNKMPDIVPARGCLENVKQLMAGDIYMGRGCRQRGLDGSVWANACKVSQYGRAAAVQQFGEKLRREKSMRERLWTLSGTRLICRSRVTGTKFSREYQNQFPTAFDHDSERGELPKAEVLNYLSRLREVPMSDADSTADEDAPVSR